MKKTFILAAFFVNHYFCYSQDSTSIFSNISNDTTLKKGIYTDYNQFISNSPSITRDFVMKSRSNAKIVAFGGTEYELVFNDGKVSKKFINMQIWGVCDGENVYVNNMLIAKNQGFNKIEKLDYPLYYFVGYVSMADEDKDVAAATAFALGGIGGAAAGYPYRRVVVIDLRNGELLRLNEPGINKLLSSDPELMEKYERLKNIENKEPYIFQLLDQYNDKYKQH